MKRCAILDDYQGVALTMADWSKIAGEVSMEVVREHIAEEAALARRLKGCEIIVMMRERTPFPRALLAKLPDLKLLCTSGMRNLSIDAEAARAQGVVLAGTPSLGYPTPELTWGLIIALLRHVPSEERNMREGRWQETVGRCLRGRTLGILGLGRLGGDMATVGKAFGMTVIAWSQNLTRERCAELGVTYVAKDELLAQADVVTLHLVLSPRTRGLIGAREIALMKPGALLINTSRGPIVDETALIAALGAGRIAGAGLDVYDVEPLPADHALRRMPNVVLTPHLGYVVEENYRQFYGIAVENIRNWLDGKPVREVLN